jgi:hypothetical protein
MAVDRSDANMKMLRETNDVQDKTKEAIWRIQRQAAEAEDMGGKTLEELRRQGQQMVNLSIISCSNLSIVCDFFYCFLLSLYLG